MVSARSVGSGAVALVVLLASAVAQPPAPPPAARTPPPAAILKAQPPPDASWTADAGLDEPHAFTDPGLGASGVVVRDGKVYAYGDVYTRRRASASSANMTSRSAPRAASVWLRRDGKPLIIHPTGLTWDDRWGTFLGDTVLKTSR